MERGRMFSFGHAASGDSGDCGDTSICCTGLVSSRRLATAVGRPCAESTPVAAAGSPPQNIGDFVHWVCELCHYAVYLKPRPGRESCHAPVRVLCHACENLQDEAPGGMPPPPLPPISEGEEDTEEQETLHDLVLRRIYSPSGVATDSYYPRCPGEAGVLQHDSWHLC